MGFSGTLPGLCKNNLLSAQQNPTVVSDKLAKERNAGRISSPSRQVPLPEFVSSPLGLVPKKAPGEFRLIHHLSHPRGSSINDGIPTDCSTVQYASVDDAVKIIVELGTHCFLAKTDVKSAFRILPLNPSEYHLFGFSWQGLFYYDKCLAMGCASSCRIFETFSSALEWAARHKLGAPKATHILDDFLFGAKTKAECGRIVHTFVQSCEQVGIPIAYEKTVGPVQCLVFAGIELDTILMQLRLPGDKLQKCRAAVRNMTGRRSTTLKNLQSLIGLLNFACKVVVPGRAFLRRLINLTIGVTKPHHHISLNHAARADLAAWDVFLSHFNGKALMLPSTWETSNSLQLVTDSAAAAGFGAVFQTHWFYGEFPTSWKRENITLLELYPIVAALSTWGPQMSNKRLLFLTDNMALVHIINQCTSRDPKIMRLVRQLMVKAMRCNILFRARHLPGKRNVLADALSRLQVLSFKQLAPWADRQPTPLPRDIQPTNFSLE